MRLNKKVCYFDFEGSGAPAWRVWLGFAVTLSQWKVGAEAEVSDNWISLPTWQVNFHHFTLGSQHRKKPTFVYFTQLFTILEISTSLTYENHLISNMCGTSGARPHFPLFHTKCGTPKIDRLWTKFHLKCETKDYFEFNLWTAHLIKSTE